MESGAWRDALEDDNTSGGQLHGDLPLARFVRVSVRPPAACPPALLEPSCALTACVRASVAPPQMWVLGDAPKNTRLKDRDRADFGVEHGFYSTASNRRGCIFPLFKLSEDGEGVLSTILSSDAEYDRSLIPAEPEDVVEEALAHIRAGTFQVSEQGAVSKPAQ